MKYFYEFDKEDIENNISDDLCNYVEENYSDPSWFNDEELDLDSKTLARTIVANKLYVIHNIPKDIDDKCELMYPHINNITKKSYDNFFIICEDDKTADKMQKYFNQNDDSGCYLEKHSENEDGKIYLYIIPPKDCHIEVNVKDNNLFIYKYNPEVTTREAYEQYEDIMKLREPEENYGYDYDTLQEKYDFSSLK